MSATSRLKAIDFYRKIPRDLTEASLSGAGLSIIAAVSMTLLFGMELSSYLTMSTTTSVIVDQSPDGDLLRINFNFSFPSLSCEFASVDVSDVLGTARFNLSKTVRKFPIDHNFQVVGPQHHPGPVPTPSKHGDDPHDTRLLMAQPEESGALVLTDENWEAMSHEYPVLLVNFYAPWCPYSRKMEPAWEKAAAVILTKYHPDVDGRIRMGKVDCTIYQQLCRKNHIQGFPSVRIFRKGNDIREAHGHHDHESYYGERDTESLVAFAETLVPPALIEGRVLEEVPEPHADVRRAPQSSGCNIEGFVLVKKVPGNLMVSAHSGAHSFDASTMNMTHWVYHFSFGRPLTRKKQHQVERLLPHLPDNQARISNHFFKSGHDNVTHDHFLQVVMTEVQPLHETSSHRLFNHYRMGLQSYDYTVHSHMLQNQNVPVARFHYELSPMQILIKENYRSFSHFITNLCAIVGGVFTVAGIIDAMLHTAHTAIKKVNLGKQY